MPGPSLERIWPCQGWKNLRSRFQQCRSDLAASGPILFVTTPSRGDDDADNRTIRATEAVAQLVQQQMGFRTVAVSAASPPSSSWFKNGLSASSSSSSSLSSSARMASPATCLFPTPTQVEHVSTLASRVGAWTPNTTVVAVGNTSAMELGKAIRSSLLLSDNATRSNGKGKEVSPADAPIVPRLWLLPTTLTATIVAGVSHAMLWDPSETCFIIPNSLENVPRNHEVRSQHEGRILAHDWVNDVIRSGGTHQRQESSHPGEVTLPVEQECALSVARTIFLDVCIQRHQQIASGDSPPTTWLAQRNEEDIVENLRARLKTLQHSSRSGMVDLLETLLWQSGSTMSSGADGCISPMRSMTLAWLAAWYSLLFDPDWQPDHVASKQLEIVWSSIGDKDDPEVVLLSVVSSLLPFLVRYALNHDDYLEWSSDEDNIGSRGILREWLQHKLSVPMLSMDYNMQQSILARMETSRSVWQCRDAPISLWHDILTS